MLKKIIYLSILLNELYAIPIQETHPEDAIDILLTGLAVHNDIQPENPFLTIYDDHECCLSCGYQWCEDIGACIRSWDTYCSSLMNGH